MQSSRQHIFELLGEALTGGLFFTGLIALGFAFVGLFVLGPAAALQHLHPLLAVPLSVISVFAGFTLGTLTYLYLEKIEGEDK